jgi:hypothetical protein
MLFSRIDQCPSANDRRFATEDSLKEIHRVLRPGAAFGMIWNIEDCKSPLSSLKKNLTKTPDNGAKAWPSTTKWEQKLKDIIASLEDGHPRFRHMVWKQVFENQLDTSPLQALKDTFNLNFQSFSLPVGEDDVKWTVWLTDEDVWSRFGTLSQIANQTEDKRAEIRKEVLEALKGMELSETQRVRWLFMEQHILYGPRGSEEFISRHID